jgi:hypothetical protein
MSNRLVKILSAGMPLDVPQREFCSSSASTVAGTTVATGGDRSRPGENLLDWPWRCVWIDRGNGQLARDWMRDNPVRHRRSSGCLETSDGRVSATSDAAGMRFREYVAPIFSLPKHALKNSRAEDLIPRFGQ